MAFPTATSFSLTLTHAILPRTYTFIMLLQRFDHVSLHPHALLCCIKHKLLVFMFKALHGLAPPIISFTIEMSSPASNGSGMPASFCDWLNFQTNPFVLSLSVPLTPRMSSLSVFPKLLYPPEKSFSLMPTKKWMMLIGLLMAETTRSITLTVLFWYFPVYL